MNEDLTKQILSELQRLRRSNNIAAAVCVLMLVGLAIYIPLRFRTLKPPPSTQQEGDSWRALERARDRFDYDTAAAIAQRIVRRFPNDCYGHAYLGSIALATGHVKEAEGHYARACEILPTDENQRMLRTIQQRLHKDAAPNDAKKAASSTEQEGDSWETANRAMDRFDYDTAAAIAQRIVQRFPNDYYGHTYLGTIALATGHVKEAEGHYARACEILPTEENQRMLRAIQQRLQKDAATNDSKKADPK